MKLFKKLDNVGLAHIFIPLLAIVGIGIVGSYLLVASHADSTQVTCGYNGHSYTGQKEYNCGFYQVSPVLDGNGKQVGTLHAGTNWIVCQQKGATYHHGNYYNYWWARTVSDQGPHGWVNAVYGKGGVNNGSFGGGVPNCNGKHGTTPNLTSAPAPAPKPTPAPAPKPPAPKPTPTPTPVTPYKLSCSATFGAGTGSSKINASVTFKNVGGSTSPATITGYIGWAGGPTSGVGGGGAGPTAEFKLPALAVGQSYAHSVAVGPYPGQKFQLTAGAYTTAYVYTSCSGSRSYTF